MRTEPTTPVRQLIAPEQSFRNLQTAGHAWPQVTLGLMTDGVGGHIHELRSPAGLLAEARMPSMLPLPIADAHRGGERPRESCGVFL